MQCMAMIAALTLAAAAATDDSGELLTLQRAQEMARQRNVDALQAREVLERASILTKKVWTALLPVLSAQASIVRNNQEILIPAGAFGGGAPATDLVFQRLVQSDAAVNLRWPLVNVGAITATRMAHKAVAWEEQCYAQREQALVHGATLQYYAALSARRQVQIRQNALETAQAHIKLARAHLETGSATEIDALRAEVEVAEAEQALLGAENAERVAKLALALTLGLTDDAGNPVPFHTESPAPAVSPTVPEEPLTYALTHRADLRTQTLQVELAELQKIRTWTQLLPTLSATGAYRWTQSAGFAGRNTTWQVGLKLEWTFFDGGWTVLQAQENAHSVTLAALALEKTRRDVRQEVQEAIFEREAAEAALAVAERGERMAERSAALVEAQYKLGAITQIDMLDAQRQLVDAQSRHVLAELSVNVARVTFAQVIETPTKPDAACPPGGIAATIAAP